VLGHLVEEELGRQPLALEPALHVGEGEHDGVDLALTDLHPEPLQAEHPALLAVRPVAPDERHQEDSSCSISASSSADP
jgi:hypothetical protein